MEGRGDIVALWLRFSQDDLRMADIALENEMWSQGVFHSQQAVEKALKAVLHRNKIVVFKHRVLRYVLRVEDFQVPLLEEIEWLDEQYARTRYPVPDAVEYGKGDAERALKIAKRVLSDVEVYLGRT